MVTLNQSKQNDNLQVAQVKEEIQIEPK